MKILLLDDDDCRRVEFEKRLMSTPGWEVDARASIDEADYRELSCDFAAIHYSNAERKSIVEKWGRGAVRGRVFFSGDKGLRRPHTFDQDSLIPAKELLEYVVQWAGGRPAADSPLPDEVVAGRHALSNAWGAYALWRTAGILLELETDLGRVEFDGEDQRAFMKAMADFGCQHQDMQAMKAALKSTGGERGVLHRFRRARERLSSLLKMHRDSAHWRVLVVDDETSRGWKSAYQSILGPAVEVTAVATLEAAEKEAVAAYDLALIDLRLKPESDPTDVDRFNAHHVSGLRLLSQYKKQDPVFPVVMCTASNKSWSYRAMTEAGGDGYWCKADPDQASSVLGPAESALALLEEVVQRLEWAVQVRDVVRRTRLLKKRMGERLPPGLSEDRRKRVERNLQKRAETISELLRRPRISVPAERDENSAAVAQSQFEIAFLYLWTWQWEVIWNVNGYQDGPKGNYRLQWPENTEIGWLDRREGKVGIGNTFRKQCEVLAESSVGRLPDGLKDLLNPRIGSLGTSKMETFVAWYLCVGEGGAHSEVWKWRDDCRKIRNKLDLTHGFTGDEVSDKKAQRAIDKMLKVLETMMGARPA